MASPSNKLRAVLASLDEVDPALHGFYRADDALDGRFVLDVEESEGFGLANVGSLTGATQKERRNAANAARERDALKARLAEIEQAKAALEEQLQAGVPDAKQLRESLNAALKKQYDSVLTSKEAEWKAQHESAAKRAEALAKQLERAEFRAQLAAVSDYEFSPRIVEPHLRGRTRFEFDEEAGAMRLVVLDANGEPKLASGKPATLRDLLAEFANDRDFGALIARKDGQPAPSGTANPRKPAQRGQAGAIVITREQARDTAFYRSEQARAAKEGREFVVQNDPGAAG